MVRLRPPDSSHMHRAPNILGHQPPEILNLGIDESVAIHVEALVDFDHHAADVRVGLVVSHRNNAARIGVGFGPTASKTNPCIEEMCALE